MADTGGAEFAKKINEVTTTSQRWLKEGAGKIARWATNTAITIGGEFFTLIGGVMTPVGVVASLLTANPVPLALTLPSFIGSAIEWGGAKHSGKAEKTAFVASKLAVAGGGLFTPAAPVLMGMSAGSGLIAQRHRS